MPQGPSRETVGTLSAGGAGGDGHGHAALQLRHGANRIEAGNRSKARGHSGSAGSLVAARRSRNVDARRLRVVVACRGLSEHGKRSPDGHRGCAVDEREIDARLFGGNRFIITEVAC